jgi:hypothetical protein
MICDELSSARCGSIEVDIGGRVSTGYYVGSRGRRAPAVVYRECKVRMKIEVDTRQNSERVQKSDRIVEFKWREYIHSTVVIGIPPW